MYHIFLEEKEEENEQVKQDISSDENEENEYDEEYFQDIGDIVYTKQGKSFILISN